MPQPNDEEPENAGPPPNDEGPESAGFYGDSVNDHANGSDFTLDNDEPGVPKSVLQIHNELARGVDTGRAPSALYREAGLLIPYAIPEYPRVTSKETDKWAMLEWQDKQLREAASRRKKPDLDSNCELDMAHFLLKTEITHRSYRELHELMEKYIPVEELEGGLDHPCAALIRLPLTKETLEARTDRAIQRAGRSTFKKEDVPVFCLEREIGSPTTEFRYRDIVEVIVEIFGRIDPETLDFEPKTGPPFGHYTTSEQFAYFADRVRRENPVADPQYGYCKALVLMVGCDGCASGGLKKIHCVPGLSHAQVHVGGDVCAWPCCALSLSLSLSLSDF